MFEQNYQIIKKKVNEGFYSTKYYRKVSDDVINVIGSDYWRFENLLIFSSSHEKICQRFHILTPITF